MSEPFRLVEANWTGIDYNVWDSIQGLLVEHPGWYYMAPSYQWLCYLTRDHGLIMLTNDFSAMSEEDIDEYIVGVLEMMYSNDGNDEA